MSAVPAFAHWRQALPDALPALASAEARGLPGPTDEAWHYTDLARLGQRAWNLATPATALPSDLTVAVSDATVLPMTPITAVTDAGRDGLALLGAALARTGVRHRVTGAPAQPLLITHGALPADGAAFVHHRIQLEPGASATLIVLDTGDGSAHESWLDAVLELDLAAGSQLQLIRVQTADPAAVRTLRTEARLARDARLQVISLDFGARLARHTLELVLTEPGAAAEQSHLALLGTRQHADQYSLIRHSAPHCSSRINGRLLAADKARGIFNARVLVEPGAVKTDSETRIASLLLSPGAEIDAKPELEIYADDVKCAHGATFGQLDADALFYLRSRGISEREARGLLTLAFADSVLDAIRLPALRDWAGARVQASVGSALA